MEKGGERMTVRTKFASGAAAMIAAALVLCFAAGVQTASRLAVSLMTQSVTAPFLAEAFDAPETSAVSVLRAKTAEKTAEGKKDASDEIPAFFAADYGAPAIGVLPEFEEPEGVIDKRISYSKKMNVTADEFNMLCCVVQREVADLGLLHKQMIVNVIMNRVRSKKFPDTVYEVLHQKNQFPTIKNYYNTTFVPDEVTVRAVSEVINGECPDLSEGAVYFYDPRYCSQKSIEWFEETLEFLFELDCHRFFK